MEFKKFIESNIRKINHSTTPDALIRMFLKTVDSSLDLIQYLQLSFLFEVMYPHNIIRDIFNVNTMDGLISLVEKYSNIFDNKKISSHIYVYYIYSFLKLKGLDADSEIEYFNPLLYSSKDLKKYKYNNNFGTGAFLEEDFKLTVQNNKLIKANGMQSMLTIPVGIKEVDVNFLDDGNNVSFITFSNTFERLVPGLFENNKKIKYVIFDEKFKVMPKEAFKNAINLTYLMARGLKEIEEGAFSHTNIGRTNQLGVETVEKIGDSAFLNCKNLKTISFTNLKSLGEEAFYGCLNVELFAVDFNEEIVKDYKTLNSLFAATKTFKSLIRIIITNFSNNIIPDNFFTDLDSVETIKINGEIKKIGNNSFRNCPKLKELDFNYTGEIIDDYMFSSFTHLEKLPNFKNVQTIGKYAFANINLKNVTFDFSKLKKVGDHAFSGSILPDELTIPMVIGKDSFIGSKGFKHLTINNDDFYYNDENDHFLPYQLFEFNINKFLETHQILKTVTINTPLKDNYLSSWSQVENVNLGKGVNKINKNAFKGCHNLTNIKSSLKQLDISEGAFSYCTNIKTFTVDNKEGKEGLLDLDGIRSLGHNSFSDLKYIKELNLKVGFKIDVEALKNLKELTSVNYTYNINNGINAFYEIFAASKEEFNMTMKNLKTVTASFPTGIIPKDFFEGLKNIEKIKVIEPVAGVGKRAFSNLVDLTELDLEFSGGKIDDYAFYNLPKVTTFPNIAKVKYIGDYAFANLNLLNSTIDYDKFIEIGQYAFSNSVLNKILTLPKNFNKGAFFNAKGFETLEINSESFHYNSEDDHFLPYQVFAGDLKSFNSSYETLQNVKLIGSPVKNSLKGFKHIKRVIIDGDVSMLEEGLFTGCENLETVFIKDVNFIINKNVFADCQNLQRIYVQEAFKDQGTKVNLINIQALKKHALNNLPLIENIVIDIKETIEIEAIKNLKNLKRVEYVHKKENNINHFYEIFNESLNGFNNINKQIKDLVVTFNDGIIPKDFFSGLINVESIKVLGDIKEVGKGAFKDCQRLVILDINFNDATIKESAFYGVSKLKDLHNFQNVKVIEGSIFDGNNLIETLNIGELDADISVLVNKNQTIKELNYYGKEVFAGYFKDLAFVTTINLVNNDVVINRNSFSNSKNLITINNLINAKMIHSNAFFGTSIKEVILNNDITFVAPKAFSGMNSLTNIKMPIKFLTLGELFDFEKSDNNTLVKHQVEEDYFKEFYIPNTLKEITLTSGVLQKGMFSNVNVKLNIDFQVSEVPNYTFLNTSNFNMSLDNVKTIGKRSFFNTTFEKVNLPTIEKIGDYAFENATIGDVSFGLTINKISLNAFLNTAINNIQIKNSSYFEYVNGTLCDIRNGVILYVIKNIPINYITPTSVLYIHKDDFKHINHLKSFDTNGAEEIEDEALLNLKELKEFTIGPRMKRFGNNVLPELNHLSKLEININYESNIKNKSLENIFGKNNLNNITHLKVLGRGIGKEFLKGINQILVLDLFDLELENLSNELLNGMKIDLISLPKTLKDIDHTLFVDGQIKEIKKDESHHFYLKDEMIFTNDELYYFFNENKTMLILDDSIKGIKKDALNKATNVKKVKFSGDIKLTNEFHNLLNVEEVIITSNTNYKLKEIFLGSYNKIKKVDYKGSIVESEMFADLSNLAFVILDKVAIIKNEGFSNNINLLNIANTLSIERLEDGSFTNCKTIDKIEFSNKLTYLTENSFINTSFNNIHIKNNKHYKEEDGFIIDLEEEKVILTANNINPKVHIKSHINEIDSKVFNYPQIRELTLNSVNVIKEGAFVDSSINRLEVISVKNVEKAIFNNNNAPKVLKIPFIGKTEDDLKDLSYLLIDPNYKEITGLNDITITQQTHFDKTFKGFNKIDKLRLLNLEYIEEETFYGCKRISLYVKDKNIVNSFPKKWNHINEGFIVKKVRLRQLK